MLNEKHQALVEEMIALLEPYNLRAEDISSHGFTPHSCTIMVRGRDGSYLFDPVLKDKVSARYNFPAGFPGDEFFRLGNLIRKQQGQEPIDV